MEQGSINLENDSLAPLAEEFNCVLCGCYGLVVRTAGNLPICLESEPCAMKIRCDLLMGRKQLVIVIT